MANDRAWYNDTKNELASYYQQSFDCRANDIAKFITDLDLLDAITEDVPMADVNGMYALELKMWFNQYSIAVEQKNNLNKVINNAYAIVTKLCSH